MMNNLDEQWQMIAIQFRLCYNGTLLTPINVNEGPFLKNPAWAPYSTFFLDIVNDQYLTCGSNVLIAIVIFINPTSRQWNPPFPSGNGTLATIQFSVNQSASLHDKCDLTLANVELINATAQDIPYDTQNGFLKIRLPADTNGDGIVDGNDLIVIARAFGAYGPNFMWPGSEPHSRWYPNADVNGDNVIDGLDLVITARSFGKTY